MWEKKDAVTRKAGNLGASHANGAGTRAQPCGWEFFVLLNVKRWRILWEGLRTLRLLDRAKDDRCELRGAVRG